MRRLLVFSAVLSLLVAIGAASDVGAAGGTLDQTFGTGGAVLTDFPESGGGGGLAYAIATSPQGKRIVVGGQVLNDGAPPPSGECGGFLVTQQCGDTNYDWGIVRYNADGSLDTSFGDGSGRAVIAGLCADGADEAPNLCGGSIRAVLIAPDGSIFAGGDLNEAGGAEVAHIAADGTSGTILATPIARQASQPGEINALALDGSDVIGVGWTAPSAGGYDLLVARWLPNGALDSSFGQGGVVELNLAGGALQTNNENLTGVAVLADGKIVAAGYATSSTAEDLILLRFNADGTPDTSFGTNGVVRSRANQSDTALVRANALAVSATGKLVVAGGGDSAIVARYNTDGTLDPTFATNGVYATSAFDGGLQSVSLDAGGGVVAAGRASGDWKLLRLTSTGAADTTFGSAGDGTFAFAVGQFGSPAEPVAETFDCAGRPLLAGTATAPNSTGTNVDYAAARVTSPAAPPTGSCTTPDLPVISTRASTTSSTLPAGTAVNDTATVAGPDDTPTGTVSFFLCQPATVAANGGNCNTGGDQVGSPVTLSSKGVASSASSSSTAAVGTYCWRAEYSGDSSYLSGNESDECFTTVPSSDVSIKIADSPDPVVVGQDLTYTLTAHSNGPDDAAGAVVHDTLPAGVTFVSDTSSQGGCSGSSTISCALGSLANGSDATVTIVVTVGSSATSPISDTGTVSEQTADPNTANNSATTTTTITAATGSADLSVTITADATPAVTEGDDFSFATTIRNHGPSNSEDVMFTAALGDGVDWVDFTTTQGSCQGSDSVACNLGTIPAGAAVTVGIDVTVLSSGDVSETATATASTPDPHLGNNTVTDQIPAGKSRHKPPPACPHVLNIIFAAEFGSGNSAGYVQQPTPSKLSGCLKKVKTVAHPTHKLDDGCTDRGNCGSCWRDPQTTWFSYDEIDVGHHNDPAAIQACAGYTLFGQEPLVAYYGLFRGGWATTGHEPAKSWIRYRLLELYDGHDITTGSAPTTWRTTYLKKAFGAVVNIAGGSSSDDAAVGRAVYNVCRLTPPSIGLIGLYAGHAEPSTDRVTGDWDTSTKPRIEDILTALNECFAGAKFHLG